MLPREVYQRLFKFAFLRNPRDLQVSSYHHIKRERPQLLEDNESFGAFLRRTLDPQREWQYHIDTSITPQLDYLIDLRGNQIVDFVGRYKLTSITAVNESAYRSRHCPTDDEPMIGPLTVITMMRKPKPWSSSTSPLILRPLDMSFSFPAL